MFIFFLLLPLIIFALSSQTSQRTAKVAKQKENKTHSSKTNEPSPNNGTQLGLFLDDDDFDIIDLINADRRSK